MDYTCWGKASRLCYVNTIVLAIQPNASAVCVRYMEIDVHHDDGIEVHFKRDNRVMTVSFHCYKATTKTGSSSQAPGRPRTSVGKDKYAMTALRETASLPCARDTRQRLKNTRQSLCHVPHTAKNTRRYLARQRALCRVPNIGAHGNVSRWASPPLDADDGR